MTRYVVQLFEVVNGGEFGAPDGCDPYPHTVEPVVHGDRVGLVLVWRKTPPPIVDPPRENKPSKKRKAKA